MPSPRASFENQCPKYSQLGISHLKIDSSYFIKIEAVCFSLSYLFFPSFLSLSNIWVIVFLSVSLLFSFSTQVLQSLLISHTSFFTHACTGLLCQKGKKNEVKVEGGEKQKTGKEERMEETKGENEEKTTGYIYLLVKHEYITTLIFFFY